MKESTKPERSAYRLLRCSALLGDRLRIYGIRKEDGLMLIVAEMSIDKSMSKHLKKSGYLLVGVVSGRRKGNASSRVPGRLPDRLLLHIQSDVSKGLIPCGCPHVHAPAYKSSQTQRNALQRNKQNVRSSFSYARSPNDPKLSHADRRVAPQTR